MITGKIASISPYELAFVDNPPGSPCTVARLEVPSAFPEFGE